MTKYTYLIVDDEPLARKLIHAHASKVDALQESGVCGSAVEAANFLRKTPVDLLFLDIQMPELSGLEFIKTLKQPPAIILTTAYREYAAEAFELDVVDYLIKPISFERFLKGIDKVISRQSSGLSNHLATDEILMLKSDRKIFPVEIKSILYIESLDNYVKVHLTNQTLVTRETITTLEEKLEKSDFVRIHRSFLIARKFIRSISAEGVQVGSRDLPFGRAFKHEALKKLT